MSIALPAKTASASSVLKGMRASIPSTFNWLSILWIVSRSNAPRRSMNLACCSFARTWSVIPCLAKYLRVCSDLTMAVSPSTMSSLGAPCVATHNVLMTLHRASSVLSSTSTAACHRVHLSNMWKMMCLWTNNKSHSTWWLKVSANSVLHTLFGPGRVHSLHTLQVSTISGMS